MRAVRRSGTAIVAVATAAVIAGAGVASTYTPLFRARHLVVLGADRVSDDAILEAARFTERTNVIHVDLAAASAGVGALPWVREVTIDRELPDTLIVSVHERVPIATILLDGRSRLVSRDGAVLDGVPEGRLPELVPLATQPARAEVTGAAGALAAMPRSLVREVEEVVLVPGGSLLIRLRSGVVVDWGMASEAVEKAQSLAAVIEWTASSDRAIDKIDVTVPQAPRVSEGSATELDR